MPNKIKDIFSDDMFNINGTLRFSDDEAYKNFLSALEIAYAEGVSFRSKALLQSLQQSDIWAQNFHWKNTPT